MFTNVHWAAAAPFRKLKVYDAISDLPVIKSGGDPSLLEMSYDQEAKTHFQRLVRSKIIIRPSIFVVDVVIAVFSNLSLDEEVKRRAKRSR